ncbi:SUMF1/EgtB/PvdO family nonheme iron enzyme [Pelodictyon phaeoclathratiforme]|uniref:SUMF1/EgtB/PvdO family nonheme iron enzyme n=1 Tax=Pelodictyon phaeoclathratiforme TaxID=34090 RepID=UPI00005406FC|nr:SUMF1/EgtB/PvdO family nonheme iron enzyme [Pelodictyon phaeoclathratiforme]MBV5289041.1 SUMF1/EgtB/PvdO family nonheme iron enzyme [Pelodictyon phaeoclathratiforme]
MALTWLHVSDFHLSDKGPYSQEVILRSLVSSVRQFREKGEQVPDLIFATGDIAQNGKAKEYDAATIFCDDLLEAAGLNRDRLFIIPGNHDVDRKMGKWSHRNLDNAEDADEYFDPDSTFPQLRDKFQAFSSWYNDYFKTIRSFPTNTTCSSVELVTINGLRLAVLPLNSALFCIDDHDHAKLFIGCRCFDAAKKQFEAADLKVAMIHHPLDWLSPIEQSNIEAKLEESVDLLLQGHYHQTSTKSIVAENGGYLKLAAGAAYQKGQWSKSSMYATFDGSGVTIFPIRYEGTPREVWTLDTSLYPLPSYTKQFPVPGRNADQQVSSLPLIACDNGMVTASGRPEINSYERYRESLRNQFGIVASRGLDNYQDIEIPLEDVFIDLHISELYGKVDAHDKGHSVETKKMSQDALLQEIFHGNARTNVLLLIGDPGSGKTTLLQHYAMLCLEGDHGRLFPEAASVRVLFLELRKLNFDAHNKPVRLAAQIVELNRSLSLAADEAETWWRGMGETERVLVLLDGLDEVTELEKRKAICQWIDEEGHAYPNRFFIVTTRKTGYVTSDGVELIQSHRRAALDDLEPDQQWDFLLKWFRAASKFEKERGFTIHDTTPPDDKARELYAYLYPQEGDKSEEMNSEETEKKKKGLQQIAGIPLLLKLMALLYKLRDFKPDSRIALYRVVIVYLLHGRDNARQISYGIDPEQSATVLGLLAYTMQKKTCLDLSEGEMKEIMESRFQSINTTVGLDTFFGFMVNRSGILKPNGKAFRFWHKTFQEYLASLEMLRCSKSDAFIRSIVQHYDDRKWEWDETLRFYFAQIDADIFDGFMNQLFNPEITTDVLQRKLQLMKTLIRESRECSTGALCRKLKDSKLSLGVQWHVLDCLEVINKSAALDAVRNFHERAKKMQEPDNNLKQRVLDKADGLIIQLERRAGIKRNLPPREKEKTNHDSQPKQRPRIISNTYEDGVQYILIRKGSYLFSKTNEEKRVEDLYFAKCPVTNKLYRSFIAALGKETALQKKIKDIAQNDRWGTDFAPWLKKGKNDLAALFRSENDEDRKFGGDEQPVVGIPWYAAQAYCLWLSQLEDRPDSYRLPTEVEWEWAAGGRQGEAVQKVRDYPWADEKGGPSATLLNYN